MENEKRNEERERHLKRGFLVYQKLITQRREGGREGDGGRELKDEEGSL